MKATEPSRSPLVPAADWMQTSGSQEIPGFAMYLLLAAALAALLRFYRLDGQSLWVDEILTWRQIRPGADLVFWQQIRDSVQGPLYQAIVWPLVRLHANAFWMRLPAAVAGVVSVPILGYLGARFFGQRTGLLAALLLAINPFHIWYSQESRGYAFMILFAILAGYLFLEMMAGRGSLWTALALGAAGGLTMAGNLSGTFFWFALGLTWLLLVLLGQRGHTGHWLLAFALGLMLILPWLLQASGIWAVGRVLPGAETGDALRGASTFTPLAVPYTIFSFCFGYSFGPSLAELHRLGGQQILAAYWPHLLIGAGSVMVPLIWVLGSLQRRRWILLVWIVVPFAVLLVLSLRNIKPWNPRYLSTALPWLIILLAAGLVRLPGKKRMVLAGLLLVITLFSLGNYYWAPRYAKADLRAAAEFLENNNQAGEPVVVPVVTEVFAFYYHGPGSIINSYHFPALDGREAARQFMESRLPAANNLWLVLARDWDFDAGGYLPTELAQTGSLLQVFKASGVKIYHWQRRIAEPR